MQCFAKGRSKQEIEAESRGARQILRACASRDPGWFGPRALDIRPHSSVSTRPRLSVADGKLLSVYDKMHLVMFGEYVPLFDLWPSLYKLTPMGEGLTPGSGRRRKDRRHLVRAEHLLRDRSFRTCSASRSINSAARAREPDVLVNLTNDGWFWGSSELDLHLHLRRVPRGRMPQAAVDRRQYRLLGLDRRRGNGRSKKAPRREYGFYHRRCRTRRPRQLLP